MTIMNNKFARIYINSLKFILAMCAIILAVAMVFLVCGYFGLHIYASIRNEYISFPIIIILDVLIVALAMSVVDWFLN